MEKQVTKLELSPREAAAFLGIERKQVLRLIKSGVIDFRKYNHENKILWIDLFLYKKKAMQNKEEKRGYGRQ